MLRKLIREPLVHFVAAALAIFFATALIPDRPGPRGTIHVSPAEIDRLAGLYANETGRLPGPDDLKSLVAEHVEDSALALEARRLGLDEGDTVVQRRLAQKMRFMINDLSVPPPPSETVLRAWFDANADAFKTPAETSFEHVFVRDAEAVRLKAIEAQLNGPGAVDWRMLGDAFMLERAYTGLPDPEIDRLFGRDFTRSLGELPPGPGWRGPVTSAFGVHFVRITDRQPAEVPPFDAVRGAVLAHWQEAELTRANAEAVRDIVSRYKVEFGSKAR